jgi:hypothetical protein
VLGVKRANLDDLDLLLAIASGCRTAYAEYQPRFWRPAPDAAERQRAYFTAMLDDDKALVLTATEDADLRGFAIGRLVSAPPVYDPGGVSCVVDDFAVAAPDEWSTIGSVLFDALRSWAASRDAAQMIVVTARLDEPKRAALQSRGLTLASEWWVGSVD